MGSGGGGGGSTTKPWSGQQRQAYQQVYSGAGDLIDTELQYGPSTVAPLSDTTSAALTGLGNYGLSTATPIQTAQGTLDQIMVDRGAAGPGRTALAETAQGGFLGSNPYLDAQFDRAADRVTDAYQTGVVPGIDSRFAGSGRVGSGFHAHAMRQGREDFGDTLGDMAAQMYGQDYARERGLMTQAQGQLSGFEADDTRQQLAAVGLAPAINQAQVSQLGSALTAGGVLDDYQSRVLSEEAARHQFEQMEPYQRLGLINSLLGGGGSGGFATTTDGGGGGSPMAGAAGGALAGAGTGAMIGSAVPGIGTAIGAGAGALVGGLGGYYGSRQ